MRRETSGDPPLASPLSRGSRHTGPGNSHKCSVCGASNACMGACMGVSGASCAVCGASGLSVACHPPRHAQDQHSRTPASGATVSPDLVAVGSSRHSPWPPGLPCPVCEGRFTTKKEVLGHLRTTMGEQHDLIRQHALSSPHQPALLSLGVMCCPNGCGACFDGGNNNTSRPLAAHLATKRCRPRLQARHNRTR